MKRIISLITAAVIMISSTVFTYADGGPEITAPSAILVEKTTGRVLYEKNPDEKMRPASVTKIRTILLIMEAIENGQLNYNDTVTASAYATSMGGSQVYLKENEQMSVDDMLKCIVVASANDACVAMAEHIAGSVDEFVVRMNERAQQLGMTNTSFKNCTGLEAEGHLTTARDISMMSRELLKHDDIKKYTKIWMDSIRGGQFGLTNTNKLIRFYDKATGLKTGYTKESMYCISATAEDNGMELIAVIMAAPSSDERNADAKTLLNYGFSKYALYSADKQELTPVKVIKGKAETVQPQMQQMMNLLVEKGTEKDIKCEITLCEDVMAPVEKGQKLGEAKLVLNGEVLSSCNIEAQEEVPKAGVFDMFMAILNYFLIL